MLNLMDSFELQAISTIKQFVDFTHDAIPDKESINLGFGLEIGMNDAKDSNECILILGCKSQVNDIPEEKQNPLRLEIIITYSFLVTDPAAFFEESEELRAKILSNFVYLDFRRKLALAFSSVGLGSIKFPLNLEKLKSMS
ncbi:hypothetical protein F8O53_14515 [Enterobacter sp. 63]